MYLPWRHGARSVYWAGRDPVILGPKVLILAYARDRHQAGRLSLDRPARLVGMSLA